MKKHFLEIVLSIAIAIVLISCKSNEPINTSNNTAPITSNNPNSEKESNIDKKSDVAPANPSTTTTGSIKNTTCRIYFFNMAELKHYYIEKTVPIEDNALVSALTKELQSTSYNKDFLSLTDKIAIKSAKLDNKTGVLSIVFSDDYVDHMTLGTSTEGALLTSLLSTYGYNLGVNKISIYFKDKLYTGLGELPKGYFTVEYPNAKQYNP